jgi:hypothetical protein
VSGRLNKTDFGRAILIDPGADKPISEVGTLQCCHCGGHWAPQPGSGRVRGWCQRCQGPVCGPDCAECIPVLQYIENLEKGRPDDFRPIIVPTSFHGET